MSLGAKLNWEKPNVGNTWSSYTFESQMEISCTGRNQLEGNNVIHIILITVLYHQQPGLLISSDWSCDFTEIKMIASSLGFEILDSSHYFIQGKQSLHGGRFQLISNYGLCSGEIIVLVASIHPSVCPGSPARRRSKKDSTIQWEQFLKTVHVLTP